jgi:predicted secreted hydrolase
VKLRILILLAVLLTGGAAWLAWPRTPALPAARLEGLALTPQAGFSRASGPRSFSFPLDFGPHPDFQTEWWYYTGNLAAPDGRRFGYQLTFFRRAILPAAEQAARTSAWATNQVYLAHFTFSDIQAGNFHYFEQFDRGAAGLAGAEGLPSFQVWLGNWSVSQTGAQTYRLAAQQGGITLALELVDRKGPVLEGIDGYSQKGADPGNASYYFSQTRLDSSGTLAVGEKSFAVQGSSWMDHEFSTSALAPDQVGWDWFALQLDDGSELMVYTVRKADGSVDPYSQGMLIAADGSHRRLTRDDFTITILEHWQSPHSAAIYPSGWRVEVPSAQLDLMVRPRLADQELRVSFTYWEGAVQIEGARAGKPVSGSGYVELTGYQESMQGQGP